MRGTTLNNLPDGVSIQSLQLTSDDDPVVILDVGPAMRNETAIFRLDNAMPQDIREIQTNGSLASEVWDFLYETAEIGEELPFRP